MFLDVFAGVARVTRRMVRDGIHGCLPIDIKHNASHNLLKKAVVLTLIGWIFSGEVRGLIIAFPCTTWSQARYPKLRYRSCIYGRTDLTAREQQLVADGNQFLAVTRRLIRAALKIGAARHY